MNYFVSKNRKLNSIKNKIGVAYTLLSVINISIFSNLIFENQIDLIINNFKLHYTNYASVASKDLDSLTIYDLNQEILGKLKQSLYLNGITKYSILNSKGDIISKEDEFNELSSKDKIITYLEEIKANSVNNFKKFNIDLNSETYQVRILFFLKDHTGEKYFLYTEETIRIVEDRMRQLYLQIGVVIFLGIILHLLFALYLYKLIFTRLNLLKEVSLQLKIGQLSARANWEFNKKDELDDLGNAFNSMAESLQLNINTITKLNREIQIELEIGKEVQGFFLPNNDMFSDKNISIAYYPMREVSGDVYNFYKFKDGSRAIFFADAMGHGVPAALVTTIINLGLQIILRKTNSPSKVMSKLNVYLSHYLKCTYFASGIFILFPSNKNKLIYSNAAQNDPILYKKNKLEFTYLSSDGLNLGMLEDFVYPENELEYENGDKLLIYSDGITEAKFEQEQFGNDRLNNIVIEKFHEANSNISEKIIADLKSFTNNRFDDDVTCILLDL